MSEPKSLDATSVYLYFDAVDILLYVGITRRGMARNVEHNKSKPWWRHVARQEVEHFPTRELAHAREVGLIQAHCPPFNTQHNPGAGDSLAAYTAFVDGYPSDNDPIQLLHDLDHELPLALVEDQGQGNAVLRTQPQHAPIARRCIWPKPLRVVFEGGGRVAGRVQKGELNGPILFLALSASVDYRATPLSATVRQRMLKGGEPAFRILRIKAARVNPQAEKRRAS